MAENNKCPLNHFSIPSKDKPCSSMVNHTIHANNVEVKPSLLQVVQHNQFSCNPTEDSNLPLSVFVEFAATLKSNGVDPEATIV